ncbi:MATE efflux family protein [Rhodomicrobium vannielii ATCC 17100]|uniref:MATE efflux family protein n=1 Tax=Rhodomicrobium vannielii (strain ATCC 17100 / DSM 162 / LMG 4299 / NCIMB 10020 / ATH 3.1.1) TaxID=648757 RepID=E3I0T5_RHOVT|nr:MATE family efflux transporter [Rhodomicrobium vannielii]ADP71175.1 MATE efflux family protein [Rhodomicrobium vannielii ATCC 17100]
MTASSAPGGALSNRDVLKIAIPLILSNATVPLVGIADTAVMGRLDNPALIGGVALGATLFAMMFWAFGFLRMGTTGLTAQAVGAGESREVAANLWRALVIAGVAGLALFALHGPLIAFILKFVGGSAAVETATADYFSARILAAPATLANYAFVGWFIGLSRANLALALQLFLNAVNIALAVTFVLYFGMGVKGAGLAAACADYAAVAVGLVIARRILIARGSASARIFERRAFRKLLAVNGDIMIRTLCLMFALTFFAAQGARLGDVALAANAVLRGLIDLSAYVLDGFAFAAEVLVGQAIGAGDPARFRRGVRLSSIWAAALAASVSAMFFVGGGAMIDLMTTTQAVRDAAYEYLPWAAAAPLFGFACFQLDGIFIGATRTADMRNMMIVALAIYLAAWAVLMPAYGNHGLWASLMVFFAARALTLGARFPALARAVASDEPRASSEAAVRA